MKRATIKPKKERKKKRKSLGNFSCGREEQLAKAIKSSDAKRNRHYLCGVDYTGHCSLNTIYIHWKKKKNINKKREEINNCEVQKRGYTGRDTYTW